MQRQPGLITLLKGCRQWAAAHPSADHRSQSIQNSQSGHLDRALTPGDLLFLAPPPPLSFSPPASVTDTIRGQIADVNAYVEKPDVLAYGMLCAVSGLSSSVVLPVEGGACCVGAAACPPQLSSVRTAPRRAHVRVQCSAACCPAAWCVHPPLPSRDPHLPLHADDGERHLAGEQHSRLAQRTAPSSG